MPPRVAGFGLHTCRWLAHGHSQIPVTVLRPGAAGVRALTHETQSAVLGILPALRDSRRCPTAQAYSPLASGKLVAPPPALLSSIAATHGKSAAQVALRWILQNPNKPALGDCGLPSLSIMHALLGSLGGRQPRCSFASPLCKSAC